MTELIRLIRQVVADQTKIRDEMQAIRKDLQDTMITVAGINGAATEHNRMAAGVLTVGGLVLSIVMACVNLFRHGRP